MFKAAKNLVVVAAIASFALVAGTAQASSSATTHFDDIKPWKASFDDIKPWKTSFDDIKPWKAS